MGKVLGWLATLAALAIVLWPVHEQVLGTDLSCGSTLEALNTQASSDSATDQAVADLCQRDAGSRLATALVVGIIGVGAGLGIGYSERKNAELESLRLRAAVQPKQEA
jgi:hypothetical protein